MPDFFRVVSQHEHMAATALQVIMLTACRTQEVRFATWDQFDFKRKVWTIPKETMKAGKPHRVPLCDKLVEILKGIPQLDNNPHVFFGQKEGQPISDMTVLTFLQKRLERSDLTVHGFRSTFRDWAAEKTEYANEVVEMALAHTVRNQAEAAYRRGDMLERRRPLMADWADYCSRKSKVIQAVNKK
jgi:integrase